MPEFCPPPPAILGDLNSGIVGGRRVGAGFAICALLAAIVLLALPSGAAAQEPVVLAFEQPDSGTVVLRPGANEVGWVAGAADPRALFDEIAELEAVYAWDVLDERWLMAGRDVPTGLWTLYRLRPGMGLRLQIGGDAVVEWARGLVPASGKVELQPGENFVAWAGRDGWDVNQLAKGIGRQLRGIRRHDPESGGLKVIWPVAEGEETATVARGEALWVEMPRSIVWLQPTDVMPRLVFPGGAPGNVRAAAERDLRNTLDYFATEHGIQTDPDFTIYMPLEREALKRQLEEEDEDFDSFSLDDLWSRTGGWAGTRVVVKRYEGDATETDLSYQRTMTHEYFHRIQRALRNGGDYDAEWLVEGSANYAESDQEVTNGARTWQVIEADLHQEMYDDAPHLVSVEEENDTWQYYLGEIALRRLVKESHSDAWVDFYRESAPTLAGPSNSWQSVLPWRDVFRDVFNVGIDEFYAEFDVWQTELVARNGRRPSNRTPDEPARIEGRVFGVDGSPVAGRYVSLNEVRLDADGERRFVGWQQRAETDADGNFSVLAPEDGQYVLDVDLGAGQDCAVYHGDGGGVRDLGDARLLSVAGRALRNVRFSVPADACRHQLRGTVRGPDGEPLGGIRISLLLIDSKDWQWASLVSTGEGTFRSIVPQNDDYRIRIELSNGCDVYFARGGVTVDWEAAEIIRPVDGDMHIDIRVPAGTCGNSIKGRLLHASGGPIVDRPMWAFPTYVANSPQLTHYTDGDGAFEFAVVQDGGYRIALDHTDGCIVYFAGDGVTADWDAAEIVRVASRDVHIEVRVPAGACGNSINGRLLNASGKPMADVLMSAISMDDGSWRWAGTDNEGAFKFTVLQDGDYRIRIELADGCPVYFAGGGVTVGRAAAEIVRVAGGNIRVGDIRIPADACDG